MVNRLILPTDSGNTLSREFWLQETKAIVEIRKRKIILIMYGIKGYVSMVRKKNFLNESSLWVASIPRTVPGKIFSINNSPTKQEISYT